MTLFELNHIVRHVIEDSLDELYWVEGELSDASQGYGSHFYGELVQKAEDGQQLVARARLTCWARTYNMLRLRFHNETGQTLRPGMQVKLRVKVTFHETYGYALNIQDIDSTYTMGDLARRRREILNQLEADGIIDDNKSLPLPRLLKHIAVVSSATAAGYGDFCNQLQQNEYGFHFDTHLFPAVMQGQNVPDSIIAALESVLATGEEEGWIPDIVVIIRGGGASGDLSDFDDYTLAACIAQYPLPIVTGIGHERDETVLDFVAHTRVKTPTAAAAFIIEHQAQEAALLDDLSLRINRAARERILTERARLDRIMSVCPLLFTNFQQKQQNMLLAFEQRFASAYKEILLRQRHRLDMMQQRLLGLDPKQMLKRGYSITTVGGKVLRDASQLGEGDVLTTQIENAEIYSKVVLCKKN